MRQKQLPKFRPKTAKSIANSSLIPADLFDVKIPEAAKQRSPEYQRENNAQVWNDAAPHHCKPHEQGSADHDTGIVFEQLPALRDARADVHVIIPRQDIGLGGHALASSAVARYLDSFPQALQKDGFATGTHPFVAVPDYLVGRKRLAAFATDQSSGNAAYWSRWRAHFLNDRRGALGRSDLSIGCPIGHALMPY